MPLILLIILPFVGSLLAAVLPANARNTESTLAGIISLACTVQAALLFPEIANGQVLRQEIAWLPSLGLDFVVRMDGFAWMFSMLVLGIGTLVVLYARYYMSPADPVPRFFSFLLAFMGAMMGVVLSGNVLQLAFFWELTSIFSFFADWLLAPPPRCPPWGAHGADGDRHWRFVLAGRAAHAGVDGGQLRPGCHLASGR